MSGWSSYGACSATCGSGQQIRTRVIISPTTGNGASCPTLIDIQSCNVLDCANANSANCVLTEWIDDSDCSASCSGGTKTQVRRILFPGSGAGAPCGVTTQTVPCNERHCLCTDEDTTAGCAMPFRPINGSPTAGGVGMPFRRTQGAVAYADSLSSPRGASLPSARHVSNMVIAQTHDIPSPKLTTMAIYYGQLLDHDITLTDRPSFVPCPGPAAESMAITVPPGDPTFDPRHNSRSIIAFSRTSHCTDSNGRRIHVNALTHVIDTSFLYGSTNQVANILRNKINGGLLTSSTNMGPEAADLGLLGFMDNCRSNHPCYAFGDSRGNENVALTTLQTLFVREHNRHAAIIRVNSPGANDEEVLFFDCVMCFFIIKI